MSNFSFQEIKTFEIEKFSSPHFLIFIWHCDKIPPHIGCSSNQSYYSLKVNGKDENLFEKKVLDIIQKKNIPTLIIETNFIISKNEISKVYSKFIKAESEKNTCLSPIKILLKTSESIRRLADLLVFLNTNNSILNVFGVNLNQNYSGLPDYSLDDINKRLRELENVQS